jgi:hypothetical protein
VLILLTAMPIIAFLALAWRSVVGPLAPYWVFFASRQLRDSATDLLPFTNIGGIVIGARAGILAGIPPIKAYSTAVVDITCETMAQIAFTVLGLLIGFTKLRASADLAGLRRRADPRYGASGAGCDCLCGVAEQGQQIRLLGGDAISAQGRRSNRAIHRRDRSAL